MTSKIERKPASLNLEAKGELLKKSVENKTKPPGKHRIRVSRAGGLRVWDVGLWIKVGTECLEDAKPYPKSSTRNHDRGLHSTCSILDPSLSELSGRKCPSVCSKAAECFGPIGH